MLLVQRRSLALGEAEGTLNTGIEYPPFMLTARHTY